MVYIGDLIAIMEERDFDRDTIDTDSLEFEVMKPTCTYLEIEETRGTLLPYNSVIKMSTENRVAEVSSNFRKVEKHW